LIVFQERRWKNMGTSVAREIQTPRNAKDRKSRSVRAEVHVERYDDPSVQERIAQLAYSYWESRGCPLGSPEEDWLQAEREFHERERLATGPT
jgi:hypothetical protein